jgi:hypothetical protein
MTTPLQSEAIGKVTAALLDAKTRFKPAVKDAENPHFNSRFVSLAGVHDAVDEALLGSKLLLTQQTDFLPVDAGVVSLLFTRIIHESGEWLGSRYVLRPVKDDPQGMGSALTFARRYAAMALLGIAPEDDDGTAASTRRDEPPDEPRLAQPAQLRARIAALGKAKQKTLDEVAADFAMWSTGTTIAAADVELLAKYINAINDGTALT